MFVYTFRLHVMFGTGFPDPRQWSVTDSPFVTVTLLAGSTRTYGGTAMQMQLTWSLSHISRVT